MRLLVFVLCLVFTQSVIGYDYQYARQCKNNTEPCIGLKCKHTESFRFFPYNTQYGCCKNHVFDEKNYACVLRSGIITAERCNACTEFRCANGQCLLKSWQCNGVKECKDGSDEVGCGLCSSDKFRCTNKECISRTKVCDKTNDCGDGSDETYCSTKSGGWCGIVGYRCANDRCVYKDYVCDGYNDCQDNSDEQGCPDKKKKRGEIFADIFKKKYDGKKHPNEVHGGTVLK